jgi:hypothetical protein
MGSKLVENKRRHHAEKVLQKLSKKANSSNAPASKPSSTKGDASLREQYEVIREDLLKLRDDISKGIDLAKKYVDRKTLIQEFLRAK